VTAERRPSWTLEDRAERLAEALLRTRDPIVRKAIEAELRDLRGLLDDREPSPKPLGLDT
jgi:predicted DNA-binding protein